MFRRNTDNSSINDHNLSNRAEPLPLKGSPPKPSSGINRKAVTIATAFGAIVLFAALIDGMSSGVSAKNDSYRDERKASPGHAVQRLPSSYSDILRNLDTGKIKDSRGVTPETSKVSATEKYLEELRLQRLKEQALARKADISFTGVTLPEKHEANTSSNSLKDLPQLSSSQGSPSLSSSRDNFNRQDDKNYFLNHPRTKDNLLVAPLLSPFSEYQLMAGTIIPGILLTGINSDLPGKLLAQVSQNIYDSAEGRHILIPQGTKAIGEYDSRIVYGQERVLIVWTRLIFPNSKSISLEGMPGMDLSGYAGLTEKVNHHYAKILSGVVFGSIIGAGAQVARGSNQNVDPTFGQLALEGAAQNINQAGQQITEKNLNIQPTIEVSPGHRFNIFITKDILLSPYHSKSINR